MEPCKADPVSSFCVLACLIGATVALIISAAQTGVAGLPELAAGLGLLLLAYHFKQLGRLY